MKFSKPMKNDSDALFFFLVMLLIFFLVVAMVGAGFIIGLGKMM